MKQQTQNEPVLKHRTPRKHLLLRSFENENKYCDKNTQQKILYFV